jgi:hypothetical protein
MDGNKELTFPTHTSSTNAGKGWTSDTMNKIKLIAIALLVFAGANLHNANAQAHVLGKWRPQRIPASHAPDEIQVYDPGYGVWKTASRIWTYPSNRYGESVYAVAGTFDVEGGTHWYNYKWTNQAAIAYFDRHWSYTIHVKIWINNYLWYWQEFTVNESDEASITLPGTYDLLDWNSEHIP